MCVCVIVVTDVGGTCCMGFRSASDLAQKTWDGRYALHLSGVAVMGFRMFGLESCSEVVASWFTLQMFVPWRRVSREVSRHLELEAELTMPTGWLQLDAVDTVEALGPCLRLHPSISAGQVINS